MDDEIYFMHCCFAESYEKIESLIENYGYGSGEKKIENVIIKPFEKRGYKIIWGYFHGIDPEIAKKKRFYSNIEHNVKFFEFDDEEHWYPEFKITCSNNPHLIKYLTNLAIFIWERCNISDKELTLPKPNSELYFKSYSDYMMKLDSDNVIKNQSFEENSGISTNSSNNKQNKQKLSPGEFPKDVSILLPKSQKTRDHWKKIYYFFVKINKKYLEEYKDNLSKEKKGKLSDFLVAITGKFGITISERKLRNIIKVGKAGYLK